MPGPPYQWRADGGYLCQPPPRQAQAPPPPGMILIPAPPPCLQYAQPQLLVPAPVGIYGIGSQPAPQQRVSFSLPPPPPPKAEEKNEEKKEKKSKSKSTPRAPPKLLPGTNYMFPLEHTQLHIFFSGSKLWEPKYAGRALRYKFFKVDTQKTVRSMIEHTIGAQPGEGAEKCEGWCATELVERGNGEWSKGTTIEYATDKAKSTLAQCGWTAQNGESRPPVWINIHKK